MRMELLIHVHARFLHRHSALPLNANGGNYKVKLYDKDMISDDLVGEERPDEDGNVKFTIDQKSYRTKDSAFEKRPDFYMVIMDDKNEIFRTPAASNIDYEKTGTFNSTEGETIDLGTFLIDV